MNGCRARRLERQVTGGFGPRLCDNGSETSEITQFSCESGVLINRVRYYQKDTEKRWKPNRNCVAPSGHTPVFHQRCEDTSGTAWDNLAVWEFEFGFKV